MAAIIIPIIILVAIVGFSSGGTIIKNFSFSLPDFNLGLNLSGPGTSGGGRSTSQGSLEPAIPIVLDTTITEGPSEGARLVETTTVTFEFAGTITPDDTGESITFNTKITGFDDDWVSTSGMQRKVTLPAGVQEYTFFVRARVGGTIDPTPAFRTFSTNTSPYFDKITISRITSPTSSRSSTITLGIHLAEDEKVNVTNWQFQTTIDKYKIPKGVTLFTNDVRTTIKEDILLERGHSITIMTRQNPLANNVNFRTNKCFGFLEEELNISLPGKNSCPVDLIISSENLSFYSPACQDFVNKHVKRGCTFPDFSQNLGVLADFSCVSLLQSLEDKFTYDSCYQQYSQDENFIRNTWYVYNEGNEFLRRGHDRIILFDENGLFIDKYIY
ncbi:hypothetical protein IID24_00425 [Patescibacteria group bacterium]|nr:hypothetical protein [Patescibacteria group bacterium]